MPTKSVTPQRQVIIKFILLCGVFVGYFAYLSYEFDLMTGGIAALLTWSFFVLCTPVADAGFLLDFPIRLLFGVRMIVSEVAVWVLAFAINIGVLLYADSYYSTTLITRLMQKILTTPYPFWAVIILSGLGTFLSIRFGDELMDVIHHRERDFFHSHQFKHELILVAFFILVIFGYYRLITSLGIDTSM